jgi:hypothetical protein
LVAGLLTLAKPDGPVPDVSTLCRRRKGLTVTIPCRPGTGALRLIIDSTGVTALGEGEWRCRKNGASRPRHWGKAHLGRDAGTLEIGTLEIGTLEIGTLEIGTLEIGTLEIRAIEGERANEAAWVAAPCGPSSWS